MTKEPTGVYFGIYTCMEGLVHIYIYTHPGFSSPYMNSKKYK